MFKQPPQDPGDSELKVREPAHHAAGVPAVLSALRHGVREMGPVRTARTLARLNQSHGFDCMGCAWPDPDKRHHAEFCENGAKAVAEEATRFRADRAFFAQWSVEEIAAQSDFWIGKRGRLTEPMYLAPGATHYEPITWDAAYGVIGDELAALGSPDEATFYTSGRTSNEAAFAYQAFVRAFGTNNLPDCSNMCHESSGVALNRTVGIGKGSVTLEDVERADLLLVIGQNPGTNHPRMLSALEAAKARGAKVVSINPLREAGLSRFDNPQKLKGLVGRGTRLADLHLSIRINGDMALFQAVNRRLLERDAVDHAFIERHCGGFEALRTHLLSGTPVDVSAATGLDDAEVEALTELIAGSERTIACWAMGLTQHRNSVATIQEIVNTMLLRGMIGKPGAGLCPVRGHSNVQGDRTMGIWERPTDAFLDRLQGALGFAPPRAHGLDVVESIKAMRDGRVKVFVAMGGNFLSAAPDTGATAEALRRCRLTVHVATKPNRSHVTHGAHALLLPTLGRTERDVRGGHEQRVSVEDSMSAVHGSRGRLAPASDQLRSEVAIVCELAERVLGDRVAVPWRAWADEYDLIRDAIARAIPGFEDFNTRLDAGFTLPSPPRDELRFTTASGRAELTVNEFEPVEVAEGRLLLQTLRSHDQYNTTIYGLNDRYRGIKAGRRVVLLNPADIDALGLQESAIVDLVGDGGRRAARFRVVPYDTPRGCAAAYYPETNALVPLDSVADGSGTPTSKSVVIRVEPAQHSA
ncbi:molybdopterin-dependent oxidoreductase alpha subunit [Solirubrobacter pauli]|uniref:Molybdopterin-dependent oxidoreductase alpha subunit n=1 Tax=Solirubrobacter pauli TaxID=166793 RepID=A0A660LAN3_9ACTN|nr:FdhF/YdeP family oxidoreductase [Solirubrobacter pauli]RKQ90933.1 molybdopterin-dependent oxidoreductase alpha subunit [Solirubrobacter pauli]